MLWVRLSFSAVCGGDSDAFAVFPLYALFLHFLFFSSFFFFLKRACGISLKACLLKSRLQERLFPSPRYFLISLIIYSTLSIFSSKVFLSYDKSLNATPTKTHFRSSPLHLPKFRLIDHNHPMALIGTVNASFWVTVRISHSFFFSVHRRMRG